MQPTAPAAAIHGLVNALHTGKMYAQIVASVAISVHHIGICCGCDILEF